VPLFWAETVTQLEWNEYAAVLHIRGGELSEPLVTVLVDDLENALDLCITDEHVWAGIQVGARLSPESQIAHHCSRAPA
jgi:hypothetical protein